MVSLPDGVRELEVEETESLTQASRRGVRSTAPAMTRSPREQPHLASAYAGEDAATNVRAYSIGKSPIVSGTCGDPRCPTA